MDPQVILEHLMKANITITDISPQCKTIIEDKFENLCQPLQDAYNANYRVLAIVVLVPMLITTIAVFITWLQVSYVREVNLFDALMVRSKKEMLSPAFSPWCWS